MSHLGRPSPALVISIAAPAVAMAGTGYAAITIPAHSVGHKQLKRNAVTTVNVRDHSLLARDFRAGQLPRGGSGGTGARGPAAPRVPAGPRGRTGRTGAGGPPGPTAASVSALRDPPAGTGSFTAIASTTITTTVSGRLLVNAASPSATVTCSAVGACSQSYE